MKAGNLMLAVSGSFSYVGNVIATYELMIDFTKMCNYFQPFPCKPLSPAECSPLREQRAESREQRAESREQSAVILIIGTMY